MKLEKAAALWVVLLLVGRWAAGHVLLTAENDTANFMLQARQLATNTGNPFTNVLTGGPALMALMLRAGLPLLAIQWVFTGMLAAAAILAAARAEDRRPWLVAACIFCSPPVLHYAGELQSDIPSLCLGMLLLHLRAPLLLGTLAAFSVQIRLSSIPFAVASLLLLLRHHRRDGLIAASVAGLLTLAAYPLLRVYSESWTGQWDRHGSYFLPDLQFCLRTLGQDYLGAPAAQPWLGALWLLLAAAGFWRDRRSPAAQGLALVAVLTLGMHLRLPPQLTRYYLSLWFVTVPLVSRLRPPPVVLGVVLVWLMVRAPLWVGKANQPDSLNVYKELARLARPGDRVVALYIGRCQYWTGLETMVPPTRAVTWGEYVATCTDSGARWLILERVFTAVAYSDGPPAYSEPEHLALWAERSGLAQKRYQDPWTTLYEITTPPAPFSFAFRKYYAAGQSRQPEGAMRQLRAALALVPDFPEARNLLAVYLADSEPAAAIPLWARTLQQYPHDFATAFNLVRALRAEGKPDVAARVQAEMAGYADQIGDRAWAAKLRGL